MKWVLIPLLLLISLPLLAQKEWNTRGSIEFQSDLYSFQSNSDDLRGRRPGALNRLLLNSNFYQRDGWQIPVTLVIPFNQTTTLYPNQESGLDAIIYNPANIIRIAPSYKWFSLQAGRIFPQFSELSIGNIGMWGIHVSLRPKKFVLEYAQGITQHQILPDSTLGFSGLHKRKLSALKIGVGREDANFFHLNLSKLEDDIDGFIRVEESPRAQEGLTIAPSFGLKFFKKLHWKSEVAAGIFTSNIQNSDSLNSELNVPEDLIVINASTQVDFAASSVLRYTGKSESVELRAQFIGPGFQTLGFPFMQSDRLDITLNPSFRWWQNKLFFNGSYGYRINNLVETKAFRTTQAIISANLFIQWNSQFSLGLNFSNFGIESDQASDSLKIRNISNTFSINPNYLFNTKNWEYQLAAGFAVNAFEEFNSISGETRTQANTSGNLTFFGARKGSEFSGNVGLTYFKNNDDLLGLEMIGYQLGAGYRFFKRQLRLSASVNPLIATRVGFSSDNRLGIDFKADYRLKKINSRLRFSASRNHYDYGSIRAGVYFTEWLYRISLSKNF